MSASETARFLPFDLTIERGHAERLSAAATNPIREQLTKPTLDILEACDQLIDDPEPVSLTIDAELDDAIAVLADMRRVWPDDTEPGPFTSLTDTLLQATIYVLDDWHFDRNDYFYTGEQS